MASLVCRILRSRISLSVLISLTAISAIGQSPNPQPVGAPNSSPSAKTSEAPEILSQAKAAALQIKNNFQRGLVLDEIGAAEATTGDLDAAVKTAIQAHPHTMATLTAIGEQLGKANDLARAQSIGSKLTGGEASTVFAVISESQAKKGNIEEALRTTAQIQAPEVRSVALEEIAQQQAAYGDYTGHSQEAFAHEIVRPRDYRRRRRRLWGRHQSQ